MLYGVIEFAVCGHFIDTKSCFPVREVLTRWGDTLVSVVTRISTQEKSLEGGVYKRGTSLRFVIGWYSVAFVELWLLLNPLNMSEV